MSIAILISLFSVMPYGVSPAEVDTYLRALKARDLSFTERVGEVVRAGVGTPYSDGPLGEGDTGTYDKDPLIDLTRVDCVTYVEQCLALATGADYGDVVNKLQKIRYDKGQIDFEHRNHFMIADWLERNVWCVEKTGALGVPVESLTRTISKRDFFKRVDAPTLGQDTADRAVSVPYIPSKYGAEAAAAIKQPSVIVFIGKIDWLFALHCGVFLPDDTGGTLYHASSKAGKVIGMDLAEYLDSQSTRYLGFTVHEITTPPFELSHE